MANGRQTITEFNSNNESEMGTVVSGKLQSLLTQISNSSTRKYLTGLRVTIMPDADNPVATYIDRFARLIVCTGNLPVTDESSALALYPFIPLQTIATVQQVKGIDRIILNTIVRNELSLLFNEPITVYEGETLNVLLGASWAVGDATDSPSISVCSLNVLGYQKDPNQTQMPWRLV